MLFLRFHILGIYKQNSPDFSVIGRSWLHPFPAFRAYMVLGAVLFPELIVAELAVDGSFQFDPFARSLRTL
jgi:hypothetical protein